MRIVGVRAGSEVLVEDDTGDQENPLAHAGRPRPSEGTMLKKKGASGDDEFNAMNEEFDDLGEEEEEDETFDDDLEDDEELDEDEFDDDFSDDYEEEEYDEDEDELEDLDDEGEDEE